MDLNPKYSQLWWISLLKLNPDFYGLIHVVRAFLWAYMDPKTFGKQLSRQNNHRLRDHGKCL